MGQLELQDYRAELSLVFGERNIDADHYDVWINFAYQELTSGVRFQTLMDIYTFNTVADQYAYDPGFQPLIPIGVRDSTNDLALLWVPLADALRIDFKDAGGAIKTGEPKRWTLVGNNIAIQPPPADVYAMEFYYIKQAEPLVADDDTTEIPYVWDQAVLYLAIAHGYLMLGEENRAAAWHNKAANSIATKMDEGTILDTEPGLIRAFTVEETEHGTPNTR